ncbi:flagellar hook protein FlgE [Billgrantia kenyensis]|uniref:Flagellar hook protein FlgE n=1 Tax=Billgrantia kenyensis TaxID=321266 RepID=A0A7V9W1W4_9GAMM|nr:flagellar hook-basal body complex protein [Halomonas kenyensis]MBA2779510.1 flagellar hook protein FlgE [Halomonas kenyensis]MCG6662743.1 flagellar hook protein FlgE [Halomonas kenyensis]
MSFSQALSGLNSQSQKLGTIGNNIANSQTVGFKGSNVQFSDVFANSRVGLGTRVSAVLQNFSEGNIESTNRSLDLAVAGEGFFRYMDTSGEVVYSRNGQLNMQSNGDLVNAQGFQIMGYGLNAQGQVQVGGQPVPLNVSAEELEASATTNTSTVLNLDSRKNISDDLSVAEVGGTEISYHYANNFTVYDSLGNPVNTTVYYEKVGENLWQAKVVADGNYDADNDFMMRFNSNGTLVGVGDVIDQAVFDNVESEQAEVDAYNSFLEELAGLEDELDPMAPPAMGAELQAALADGRLNPRAGSTEEADINEVIADLMSATPTLADYDAVFTALADGDAGVGTGVAGLASAQTQLDAAVLARTQAIAGLTGSQQALTFNSTNGAEDVNFNLNLAGSTQFGNSSTVSSLTQNGYTSGTLVGITIDEDGTIMRNYSNEESRPAGQIALVSFRNPEGLTPAGDNVWRASAESGQELVGAPGTGLLGGIVSGAVETSNVDMARELVDMIVAQRAYQANSQTIKTQDELLQTAINLR